MSAFEGSLADVVEDRMPPLRVVEDIHVLGQIHPVSRGDCPAAGAEWVRQATKAPQLVTVTPEQARALIDAR